MKSLTSFLLLIFFATGAYAQSQSAITAAEIKQHIEFLASDSLKGRKPGTAESVVAAQYIRDAFYRSGLKLLGENGFQDFELVTDVALGTENELSVNGIVYNVGEDFSPLPFTTNMSLTANAVFVGYGFDISNDSIFWNDYNAEDLSGKWAIILRGSPEIEGWDDVFVGNVSERFKVMVAKDKGAAGVIFVNGLNFSDGDDLIKLSYDKSTATAGLPVLQVKRPVLDTLFSLFGNSVASIETRILSGRGPVSFSVPATFSASVEIDQKIAHTQNVIAMLEGTDPLLKNEYLVIGAHYDHLGFGGPGSGSRAIDTIAVHYGADDNASGVAGVIELAGLLAAPENTPKRSVIFIAFAAEEMGLIGSKYFVENPLVDLDDVVTMINFDMIGRLKDHKTLSIGGTGTGTESEAILNRLGKKSSLKLKYSSEGYGPSDHAAFYTKDIPVFFISTGAHEDYHTPKDNIAGIDEKGEVLVLNFSADLAMEIANRKDRLEFREAGPKTRQKHGYNFKVTLGIMPDFASSEEGGLRIDAVRPDGPAKAGGMEKGDKIVAIDGKPVENIYDYMGRLKKLEQGQIITVDVMRNNSREVLIIQL